MSGLTANEGRKKTCADWVWVFSASPLTLFEIVSTATNCINHPDACISYYDNIDDSSKILLFLVQKRKTREAKNVSSYFKPGRSQSSLFFCTAKVRFHLLSLKGVGLGVLVCPTFILKYIKNRMYDFWLSQTKENRRWQNLWSCLKNLASRRVVDTKTPFITQSCDQRQPTIKS